MHNRNARRTRLVAVAVAMAMGVTAMAGAALAREKRSKRLPKTEEASSELGPVLFDNFNPITMASGMPATPYPSNINVTGWCPGTVTDVNLTLRNFGSQWPDDVDILLVGPAGQKAIIMSDAGNGTSVEDLALTFDDEAGPSLPDEAALTSGTFKPSNYEAAVDAFPAPAPAAPYANALSTFDGTNPNGNWGLYIVDELNVVSAGDVELGWRLTLDVASTQGDSRVCIPHVGTAEPYPSTQTISGRTSPIQDVNVNLSGFTHTFPDDLDVLLQGPGGQNVMLMSEVGGGGDANNLQLNVDDEAPANFGDNTQMTSGTFKPTNIGAAPDAMPAPAPAAPHGNALSVFDGTNPNGTWRLFINDQAGVDQGFINSWSVQITTPQAVIKVKGKKAKEGKPGKFTLTRTENVDQSETVSFATKNGTAKAGKDYKKMSGTITFAAGDSKRTVKVKTKNDRGDERNEKFKLNVTAGGVTSKGTVKIKDND
jgi:subtilisin-like proprotein convertase family protein